MQVTPGNHLLQPSTLPATSYTLHGTGLVVVTGQWSCPAQWTSGPVRPTMAGPTVRVHDGMTLNALAAAVRSADIRLCLTVTEHFGWNGLGDTIAFRMLPLKFALAHEPHLRYQFAPIGTHGGRMNTL